MLQKKKKEREICVCPQNICLPPGFFFVFQDLFVKPHLTFLYLIKRQDFFEPGRLEPDGAILLEFLYTISGEHTDLV